VVLVSLPRQKFADLTVAADGVLYADETILTEEAQILAEKLTISN
jgi:hypothetical protein